MYNNIYGGTISLIKQIIILKIKSALDYLTVFFKWTFIAVIIGAVGGAVGALFHVSVTRSNELFTRYDKLILLLPLGGLLIVAMYKKTKMLGNKGTDGILASIRGAGDVPFVLAPLIFVSTVITHLLGGSAGREGAALQLGGSIGTGIGKLFRLDQKDMHMVVMCGMSALFSALFGTPITAAFFALGVHGIAYRGRGTDVFTDIVRAGRVSGDCASDDTDSGALRGA